MSQDETSAAATRNITTLVVLRRDEDFVELPELELAIDAGRDEEGIDRHHHRGFGRREDAEAQTDDDDGGQHQRPERRRTMAKISTASDLRGGG